MRAAEPQFRAGEVVAVTLHLVMPCDVSAGDLIEAVEGDLGGVGADEPADGNPMLWRHNPRVVDQTIARPTGFRFERVTAVQADGRRRVVERLMQVVAEQQPATWVAR